MTDQHRATPELWAAAEKFSQNSMDMLNCMLELRARVEALEADQLEQAESNRFCVDAIVRRVEALEAEYEETALAELRAASAEAQPAWRPLNIETTYGSEAAADAVQLLRAPMVVEGTFEHSGETYRFKAKPEREAPMTELRAASAEAMPTFKESLANGGSLLEMVAKAIYNVPHDSAAEARAAIREIATWLDRFALHGSGEYAQAAKVLRQEVGRG